VWGGGGLGNEKLSKGREPAVTQPLFGVVATHTHTHGKKEMEK
jgi:hypothetical protein